MIGRHVESRRVGWRPGGVGQHTLRGGAGEAALAHAARPGEQPGVVQAAGFPGGEELANCLVLPLDHAMRSPSA